jgi:SAM-dependent methyltransferase
MLANPFTTTTLTWVTETVIPTAPEPVVLPVPAPAAVMAISDARTNAELVDQCVTLGYLHAGMRTLDPTYGLGRFWSTWAPAQLTACDLDPAKSPLGRPVDFTALPWDDASFDAVVFDPPYKLNGTGGSHPSDAGYGVANSVSWRDRHGLIRAGISECARVLAPGGTLLVKCQDQVNSGTVRWQTREFADHAETLGCELVDMLHLVGYRPQPSGRRQVHARRNYSTLLIHRKPDRARASNAAAAA